MKLQRHEAKPLFSPQFLQTLLSSHPSSSPQCCLCSPPLVWWHMEMCSPFGAQCPPSLRNLNSSLEIPTNPWPSFCCRLRIEREWYPLSPNPRPVRCPILTPSRGSSAWGQWRARGGAITYKRGLVNSTVSNKVLIVVKGENKDLPSLLLL